MCNHPYELVLMDMRLPGMDGLTATKEIRKAEREGRASSHEKVRPTTMDGNPSNYYLMHPSGRQNGSA